MIRIRTADVVAHRPTEEEWVVAFADYNTGVLAACGWPDGDAKISDCILLRKASDEEYEVLLDKLVQSGDRRGIAAKRIADAA